MKYKSFRLFSLTTVLLAIMACSFAKGGSPAIPEGTNQPEGSAQVETNETMPQGEPTKESPGVSNDNALVSETGPCDNPYYPVREGSTWNYKGTSSAVASYSFTDTITSLRSDGYTLTSEFEKLSRTQEWACTPNGLVALQMGGGLSATGINLKVETQNASGVTYPAIMKAGDTWQYRLDFTGTMDIAGQSGNATGNTQSDYTALGVESVTVPAGTFNAMKVEIKTTFDASVTFQGMAVPVTFTGTATSWYAEGVGWVKSESTNNFAGQNITETVELQWYNIPQ